MQLSRYANGTLYECRRHTNGIFYLFWTQKGRSNRKSTGKTDIAAAQAWFDMWVDMIGENATPAGTAPTCEVLWKARYPDAHPRAYAWTKHLGPHFGHLQPSAVTRQVEADYIASRNASPSTIRLELSMLRASWNQAVRDRVIEMAALPALQPLPEASPPRDRILTKAEILRLLAAAEHPGRDRARLFLWLALHTAARRTAIEDLQWSQVDWESGVIHYLPPGRNQTRKRRASVPISDALRPVLEAARREDGPVIGSGAHVNDALNRLAAAAGVEGLTPHVLRHTAASLMARRGVPLWTIAKILGNTVEQVENTYAKFVPGMHRDAVNSITRAA